MTAGGTHQQPHVPAHEQLVEPGTAGFAAFGAAVQGELAPILSLGFLGGRIGIACQQGQVHDVGGQHIAHVVCGDGTGVPAVVHQVEGAAVPGQILVETIEKRGLSRAVAADQTVDLSLFKGEGRAPQHLLVTEPLLQVLDYQLRGHQSTMPVRSRGLPSRHRRSRP